MATLSVADVQTLLAHVEGTVWHPLWMLMVAMGLRLGEATALQWDDFNDQTGILEIRRGLRYQRGTGLSVISLKTDRSMRTIHLPEPVVEALKQHRERQRFLTNRQDWEDRGFVFTTRKGTPFHPEWVREKFYAALQECGLPRVRVHDLRHTAATWMIHLLCLPMRQVQETLGHANIAVTLGMYTHLVPGMAEDAARRIGSLLTTPTEVREAK